MRQSLSRVAQSVADKCFADPLTLVQLHSYLQLLTFWVSISAYFQLQEALAGIELWLLL